MMMPAPVEDLFDLVLGRACLACDEPGPVLCVPCLDRLRGRSFPVPVPGLAPTATAALPYSGAGRLLVVAYKERGTRSLAPMLGTLLADAVLAHLRGADSAGCVLVPVPGHRRPRRGFDALSAVVTAAHRSLRARGCDATTSPVLRPARSYPPLKQLPRGARAPAVAGSFAVAGPATHRLMTDPRPVVVVDDVLTTGATVGEAVRALAALGRDVHGVAAVTAAVR